MSELIDLSKLPYPPVLEQLDYETLLNERKEYFINQYPLAEQDFWRRRLSLESEPITKLLEENTYLQLLERSRINEAAKATMLAYATGDDLDVIAGNYNVARLVIRPADNTKTPPIPAIVESDEELRLRAQQAFEGLSVAGPRAAYKFHALSAHPLVADVGVESPKPAHVTVTVLSREDKGIANQEILDTVAEKLNDETIRPIADRVTVQKAKIIDYQIKAKVYIFNGPEIEIINKQIKARLNEYISQQHRLGRSIIISAIHSAIHVEGVQRVELEQPSKNIFLTESQASYCTDTQITIGS